jgi:hypothetical protein
MDPSGRIIEIGGLHIFTDETPGKESVTVVHYFVHYLNHSETAEELKYKSEGMI